MASQNGVVGGSYFLFHLLSFIICPEGVGASTLGVSSEQSDQSDQSDLSDGALSARRVARVGASHFLFPLSSFIICPQSVGASTLGVSSDQSDQSDLSDGALSARRVARVGASPPKKTFRVFRVFRGLKNLGPIRRVRGTKRLPSANGIPRR